MSMRRAEFDDLGDQQKAFEKASETHLMRGLPVLARIDGRAFHTWTRGLEKPFDPRLQDAMDQTVKYLIEETQPLIGYTQSDEISLLWHYSNPESRVMFDGKVRKLCSVLASLATAVFNAAATDIGINVKSNNKVKLATFDCRVWNVPSRDVATDYFIWREMDATRNSLAMLASSYFSAMQLHKKSAKDQHDMLHGIDVNWNDLPVRSKRGHYFRRKNVLVHPSDVRLQNIPEKFRPTESVIRSEIHALELPPIRSIQNMEDVLFNGAEPMTFSELNQIVSEICK